MTNLVVNSKVAKGLDLIKRGFYSIESLEKAISNKGAESHIDLKPMFEQLTKDEIIQGLFYGYEVENDKITLNDLPLAFKVKSKNKYTYHVLACEGFYFVADNKNRESARYTIDIVLGYINDGRWTVIENS